MASIPTTVSLSRELLAALAAAQAKEAATYGCEPPSRAQLIRRAVRLTYTTTPAAAGGEDNNEGHRGPTPPAA